MQGITAGVQTFAAQVYQLVATDSRPGRLGLGWLGWAKNWPTLIYIYVHTNMCINKKNPPSLSLYYIDFSSFCFFHDPNVFVDGAAEILVFFF